MKKKWAIAGCLGVLFAGGLLFAGSGEPKKMRHTEIFMRQKLGYSQKVAEGITLENYSMVITNGYRLWRMTQSNVWSQVNNVEYESQTKQFQLDVTRMLDMARASNTPALLKGYSVVMEDCVACHQQFRRDQRLMQLSKPAEK